MEDRLKTAELRVYKKRQKKKYAYIKRQIYFMRIYKVTHDSNVYSVRPVAGREGCGSEKTLSGPGPLTNIKLQILMIKINGIKIH